jgi:hypothetical protein
VKVRIATIVAEARTYEQLMERMAGATTADLMAARETWAAKEADAVAPAQDEVCHDCNGVGTTPDQFGDYGLCPTCEGTGIDPGGEPITESLRATPWPRGAKTAGPDPYAGFDLTATCEWCGEEIGGWEDGEYDADGIAKDRSTWQHLNAEHEAQCDPFPQQDTIRPLARKTAGPADTDHGPVGDVEVRQEEISDVPSCPTCEGESEHLGDLGSKAHYRCRDCGIGFSKDAAAKHALNFMNDYEIDRHLDAHGDHPVIGPAVRTLANLRDAANQNSDGWHIWPKPARAASKLMDLINRHDEVERGAYQRRPGVDYTPVTAQEVAAALRPVKAFRTRSGIQFDIHEPDRTASRTGASQDGWCSVCDERIEQEQDGSWSHAYGNDDKDHEAISSVKMAAGREIHHAQMDTESFDWHAYGDTAEEAQESLVAAWNKHIANEIEHDPSFPVGIDHEGRDLASWDDLAEYYGAYVHSGQTGDARRDYDTIHSTATEGPRYTATVKVPKTAFMDAGPGDEPDGATGRELCAACSGKGTINHQRVNESMTVSEPCKQCGGSGYADSDPGYSPRSRGAPGSVQGKVAGYGMCQHCGAPFTIDDPPVDDDTPVHQGCWEAFDAGEPATGPGIVEGARFEQIQKRPRRRDDRGAAGPDDGFDDFGRPVEVPKKPQAGQSNKRRPRKSFRPPTSRPFDQDPLSDEDKADQDEQWGWNKFVGDPKTPQGAQPNKRRPRLDRRGRTADTATQTDAPPSEACWICGKPASKIVSSDVEGDHYACDEHAEGQETREARIASLRRWARDPEFVKRKIKEREDAKAKEEAEGSEKEAAFGDMSLPQTGPKKPKTIKPLKPTKPTMRPGVTPGIPAGTPAPTTQGKPGRNSDQGLDGPNNPLAPPIGETDPNGQRMPKQPKRPGGVPGF